MRVKVLFLVLLIGVLGFPTASHAEKVKTNAKAKVYARAGEQAKVVAKVKEGQVMTLLAKEGRWLKVRVSGRTGFVPRSKVDLPDDDEISRNTRRRPFVDGRGTKRGFGSEDTPDDRVGADATGDGDGGGDDGADDGGDDGEDDGDRKPKGGKGGKGSKGSKGGGDDEDPIASDDEGGGDDDEDEEVKDDRLRARVDAKTVAYAEPSKDSDKAFTASPNDTLFVEQKKGKWTEVSVEEGDIGWIQTSKLDIDDDAGGGGGGPRGRTIDVRARLGFTLVSQTLTSQGGGAVWPDRYKVGSSSVAVALGGALLYPYKKDFLVGGELAYDLAKAIPGIAFDPDGAQGPMASSTTGFTIHQVNVRALGGYDLHKKNGMVLFGRLGYHYESFQVANVQTLTKNTARLPSEIIQGPMIGTAIVIPRLTPAFGLKISVDAILVAGKVTQTKNLEDGANPSAKRVTLGVGLTYRWKPALDLSFAYDLNYASLSFGAPVMNSQRMHAGTGVSRTDLNHTIAAGIAKAF